MTGRVLTLCTGNVCRSPYVEMRLRQMLARDWATEEFDVSSAGVQGLQGMPMEPEAVRAILDHGPMPIDHSARRLTAAMVADADLVLTATREHRAAATSLRAASLKYTFALADFAQLCASLPDADVPRRASFGDQLRAMVAVVAARRGFVPPLPADRADLVDPFRQSERVWAQMIRDTEAALTQIIRLLRPA